MTLRHSFRFSAPLRRSCALLVACLLLIVGQSAQAQTDSSAAADRLDPVDLAHRLMGVPTPPFIPPPAPEYKPGDQLEFTVGKTTSPEPTRVRATLAAATGTIYLWVENGLSYKPGEMTQTADWLDRVLAVVRRHDTYTSGNVTRFLGDIFDPYNLYPVPDVDNDPHLYVVYATDLADTGSGIYNPYDSQPAEQVPGGFSNQHEVIAVNTPSDPAILASDPQLTATAVRALVDFVIQNNLPEQPSWLTDAFGWYFLSQINTTPLTAAEASSYLSLTNTPLTQPAATIQSRIGQQMFLNYVGQRYGSEVLLNTFASSGTGLQPLTSVLAQHDVVDPVSGAPVTGDDVFADFVLTGGVNYPFGDGRFFFLQPRLQRGQLAAATVPDSLTNVDLTNQTINQYGAAYVRGSAAAAGAVTITFDGQPTTPRLPMPPNDVPDNHFYWSGGGRGRDALMTRAYDLSALKSAELTFDVWYSLSEHWNYGYVEISKDDGKTWTIVPATNSRRDNRNGVAYGPGFTGVSNPAKPEPFPIMGVVFASDGVTITQILDGSPASQTELRVGDQIAGIDGQPWPGPPDIFGVLAGRSPGDTLHLFARRGSRTFDVSVVLAAHPTRLKDVLPLWQPQRVDLTPFAGAAILVRFEAVSMINRDDQGVAIDNVTVPELNLRDDGESDGGGWTLDGWQRVDNRVPQRYVVWALTGGTQTRQPSARLLIGPESTATGGQWKLLLDADEGLALAVSALSDETLEPATYSLRITSGT